VINIKRIFWITTFVTALLLLSSIGYRASSNEWGDHSIYTYLSELFIFLLMLSVCRFFIGILNQKRELQDRLKANIEDLEKERNERGLAEATLRKSEERMRLFFERPITGLAITTPEKGWLQVNDTLCEMLGYTREELLHTTWSALTHPGDLAADEIQFKRLLSGEIDGYVLDKRFLRKDGAIVHASLSVGCVRHSDGSVDYVLAELLDVSERKLTETALAESERFLTKAQTIAAIGSWVLDVRSNTLVWSDETFRIFEVEKDPSVELFDRFLSVVHPDDKPAVMQAYNEALKTKEPYDVRHRLLMPDGRVKYVHEYCETEYDASGTPTQSSGMVQDITERRLVEMQLEQQVEELRRWHDAMVGRENRVLEMKREVNELLARLDEPPRYPSVMETGLHE
jgi:PAS domain S-box-containing protein